MGDSACWLDQLCPDCAAVLDDAEAGRCPRCDALLARAPARDPDPRQAPQPSDDISLGLQQDDGDVDVS